MLLLCSLDLSACPVALHGTALHSYLTVPAVATSNISRGNVAAAHAVAAAAM
jgi:hypothetical protein